MENEGKNDGDAVQARPLTIPEHLAVFDAAYASQDFGTAEQHIKTALVAAPANPEALFRFAQLLVQKQDPQAAEDFARRCVKLEPTNARAWGVLSGIYCSMGLVDKVVDSAERAITLAGVFPMAMWNLSHGLLRKGEYKRGFEMYEWGTVMGQRRLRCVGRQWDGSPIPGKRLFVWNEQGFGDTLMFLRFVKRAKEASQATVYCDVQRQLFGLLEHQTGADECFASSDYQALGDGNGFEFDYHCSMASLPHLLGVERESELCSGPYIAPVKWANVPDVDRGKTGLVWKGSPTHPNDRNRSIPEECVKRLEGKADWLSLQHGAAETPFPMQHVGRILSDFAFTASVLASLDRLVTCDTAVAHLAGAMGVPTIMVCPLNGEWRWGTEGPTTPWYPSVTCVRPKSFDDAIDQVAGLLPAYLPMPKVERAPVVPENNGHSEEELATV